MNDAYHSHMHGAATTDVAGRYKLGDCTFDSATGEVIQSACDGECRATRLAPKPAALLSMLIEKHGELLTVEEIRDALWPDVQVEFDQGVHTCMRQIRAALGDSASSPKYIETLPRRGYRLMTPAEVIEKVDNTALDNAPVQRSRWRFGAMILLVALLPLMSAFSIGIAQSRRAEKIPIAIMPFQPPANSTLTGIADVATLLLADFGNDSAFSVIGPSTTIRFASSEEPLVSAIRELDVRYIINGRFLRRDDRDQVLVELVRSSDGAHIWVQMYNDSYSAEKIAGQVSFHVRETLLPAGDPVS